MAGVETPRGAQERRRGVLGEFQLRLSARIQGTGERGPARPLSVNCAALPRDRGAARFTSIASIVAALVQHACPFKSVSMSSLPPVTRLYSVYLRLR